MNRLRQLWSDLTIAECAQCGERLSAFARSCPHCGAPGAAWRTSIAVAGALAGLIIALGVAAFVIFRGWELLPRSTQQQAGPRSGETDVGWLQAGMKACDEEAAKDPVSLYFLVVPLASQGDDMARWRSMSLNDIGNAILLSSDDTLNGLRTGTLRISPQEYVFSVRDEATHVVHRWNRTSGVAKFSTTDEKKIASFKIQFQTRDSTRGNAWGNIFVRQPGNCYWVNAVLGN